VNEGTSQTILPDEWFGLVAAVVILATSATVALALLKPPASPGNPPAAACRCDCCHAPALRPLGSR
jgi:hypothetical protein